MNKDKNPSTQLFDFWRQELNHDPYYEQYEYSCDSDLQYTFPEYNPYRRFYERMSRVEEFISYEFSCLFFCEVYVGMTDYCRGAIGQYPCEMFVLVADAIFLDNDHDI